MFPNLGLEMGAVYLEEEEARGDVGGKDAWRELAHKRERERTRSMLQGALARVRDALSAVMAAFFRGDGGGGGGGGEGAPLQYSHQREMRKIG
jgi:hypothetical protein